MGIQLVYIIRGDVYDGDDGNGDDGDYDEYADYGDYDDSLTLSPQQASDMFTVVLLLASYNPICIYLPGNLH